MTIRTFGLMAIAACGLLAVTLTAGGQDAPAEEADAMLPASVRIARLRQATVADAYLMAARLARTQGRIDAETDVDGMEFEELRALLLEQGFVAGSWTFDPAAGLERDTLAYIGASYLDIKPGLLTSIFGRTRRYSYREMQHRGLMVQGQPRQVVSGSELLSVLTRIASEFDRRP
jgi:hypothetical protein